MRPREKPLLSSAVRPACARHSRAGLAVNLGSILAMALALAMDAFAVSLAIGTVRTSPSRAEIARVSSTFGAFQGAMPILGWSFGSALRNLMGAVDHWIAFAILLGIGIRMIASASRASPVLRSDPTRGVVLLGLGIATSIDALAAGFTLAIVQVVIWVPALIIAAVTAALSILALGVGRRAGHRLGRFAEIAGGLVLCAIGLRILIAHLTGGV